MGFLSDKVLIRQVKDIIHKDTQLHGKRIDLTAASARKFSGAGALDFGGSEFKAAKTTEVTPEKKHTDDDYGWWNLGAGRYQLQFNETVSLPTGALGILTPHPHLIQAGILSNTQIVTQDQQPALVIDVHVDGCKIKENARVAVLLIAEE